MEFVCKAMSMDEESPEAKNVENIFIVEQKEEEKAASKGGRREVLRKI